MGVRILPVVCGVMAWLACCGARADWMTCLAQGKTEAGPLVVVTSVAALGALPKPALAQYEKRLVAYAGKVEAPVESLAAKCTGFSDQLMATTAFDGALETWGQKVGYEHMLVVKPADWLPVTGAGDTIFQP